MMADSLLDLEHSELEALLGSWGEPRYRATQVWNGLYRQLWSEAEDFSQLPRALRSRLAEAFRFRSLEEELVVESSDGSTQKTLFRTADGQAIETVLMRYPRRNTLCISTQVGCAMGCVFCATGQMGFKTNLSIGEIVEQVLAFARQLALEGARITNVVLMGMGEPFHNYDAALGAIRRLNDPQGFNMGARRFTVSTVGLVPMIKKFTHENLQANLAVSLHTVDDELRSSLLPINQKYPVEELLVACRDYVQTTSRRITFEWALIRDVNDSVEDARSLARWLAGMLCHVNIIPLNPTRGYARSGTTAQRAREFRDQLEASGIPCSIRVRRGIDIDAGCGQLAVAHSP